MHIPLLIAHCDTLSRILEEPGRHLAGNGGQWDLNRIGEFAPQAQIFAVFADSGLPDAVEQAALQIGGVSSGMSTVSGSDCSLYQRGTGGGSRRKRKGSGLFVGGGR